MVAHQHHAHARRSLESRRRQRYRFALVHQSRGFGEPELKLRRRDSASTLVDVERNPPLAHETSASCQFGRADRSSSLVSPCPSRYTPRRGNHRGVVGAHGHRRADAPRDRTRRPAARRPRAAPSSPRRRPRGQRPSPRSARATSAAFAATAPRAPPERTPPRRRGPRRDELAWRARRRSSVRRRRDRSRHRSSTPGSFNASDDPSRARRSISGPPGYPRPSHRATLSYASPAASSIVSPSTSCSPGPR